MNTGYVGNNIVLGNENLISTTELCMRSCQQRQGCTAWSHNAMSKYCFLKTSDRGRRMLCGYTSGLRSSRNCSTGMMMMSGCAGD